MALPFSYDDSGNMREKALTANTAYRFTHDAWNRLVKVRLVSGMVSGHGPADYQYNGLHQRIIKRTASEGGAGGAGMLDQQHLFYYTAAWQIAEELIETDWAEMGPSIVDFTNQYVWGVRHIDDIVLRRQTVWMVGPIKIHDII